jgi:hypothetical protein
MPAYRTWSLTAPAISALLHRGRVSGRDDTRPCAPHREDNKKDATILGSADRATTLLAGDVVHVTRDPQRIKESFLRFLRFNTTVKDTFAVGVIPIESVVVKGPPIS